MDDSFPQGSPSESIDGVVMQNFLKIGSRAVKSAAKRTCELAMDPYSWTQLASNIPDRALRLGLAHYVLTGNDGSFLINTAQLALFTAVSIPIYELVTTPVHRMLYRKKRGTLNGFVGDRIGVETQHYKAQAICTTGAILATSALELFVGIPREVTTQFVGIPFAWLQGGYTTDIRQRVDAGKPLNRPVDHAVSAPFRPLEALWKLAKGPEAAGYMLLAGKSMARRSASYLALLNPLS